MICIIGFDCRTFHPTCVEGHEIHGYSDGERQVGKDCDRC